MRRVGEKGEICPFGLLVAGSPRLHLPLSELFMTRGT